MDEEQDLIIDNTGEDNSKVDEKNKINNTDAVDKVNDKSFFDLYIEGKKSVVQPEKLLSPDEEWDIKKQTYIDAADSEEGARTAFDADYENRAHLAQEAEAEKLNQVTALSQLSYLYSADDNVDYIDDTYQQTVEVVEGTNSGMMAMLDTWTGETQSLRTSAIKNKIFIDGEGNEVEAEDGLFGEGILFNEDYADKDGNVIIGYQHGGYGKYDRGTAAVHALYANTEPIGEVVSRWDANGWMDNAALDMSLLKVTTGALINFVVDTVDTALWITEISSNAYKVVGVDQPYSWIRNTRNSLKSWSAVKSDADNNSLMTVNNAVGFGINIVGQLLSGKIVASAAAKALKVGAKYVSKLDEVSKLATKFKGTEKGLEYAAEAVALAKKIKKNSKHVGRITHFYMGSMASKDLSEEARAAGFSENEAALLGIVGLAGLGWANKLSNVGLSKVGLREFELMSKRIAKDSIAGKIPGNMTDGAMKKFLKKHSETLLKEYNKLASAKHMGAGMASEFVEEETELLVQEIINHAATAAAALGYSEDEIKPGFETVLDKGYWEKFAVDFAMSGIGGAVGGGFAHFINPTTGDGGLGPNDLPVQGASNMQLVHLAYMASRSDKGIRGAEIFKKELKRRYDKGEMGSTELSTTYDKEKERYKRMSELTDEELKTTNSQADAFYAATLGQFNFYQQLFTLSDGSFQDIIADNKQFGLVANSKELQFSIKDNLLREQEILLENKVIPGSLDGRLLELTKLKHATNPEDDKNPNNKIYDDALKTLAAATTIEENKLEELVGIKEFTAQVESGEILENAFIETVLNSDELKGSMTPKQLSQLVDAGNAGQVNFKEIVKKAKKEQAEAATFFAKVISGEEQFSQAHVDRLNTETDLFLSAKIKQALSAVVEDKIGTPLEAQKSIVAANMFAQLEETYGHAEVKAAMTLLPPIGAPVDLYSQLLAAKGIDSVLKVLSDPKNVVLDFVDGVDPDLAMAIAYTFKQVDSLEKITSRGDLQKVTFSLDKNSNKTLTNPDAVSGMGTSPFNFDFILQEYTTEEPFIGDNLNILPQDDSAETKAALLGILDASIDITEDHSRNELEFSYNKDSKGNISMSGEPLVVLYSKLLNSEGFSFDDEVTHFSNLPAVEIFLEKVRLRKAQVNFLAKASAGLSSIHKINKEVLHNEDKPSSKLTSYINTHHFDLTKLQTDIEYRAETLKDLNKTLETLSALEMYGETLLELTTKSDQNLQAEYVSSTKEEALSIFDTVTSTISQEMRENNPELNEVYKLANDFEDDADVSPEYIEKLYDRVTKIREILRSEYLQNKEGFIGLLEKEHKSSSLESNPALVDLLRIAMSDSSTVLSRMRAQYNQAFTEASTGTAEEVEAKLKALKLPTIKQLIMVEEAVLMATTDFIEQANKFSVSKEFYNLGVFNGRQGTGKTEVVGVQAALLIQEIINAKSKDGKTKKIVFAANDPSQADILGKAAENAGVERGSINNTKSVTQKVLWDLLVKSDLSDSELYDRLDSVGTIIYDEIAYVEFSFDSDDVTKSFTNAKEAPVLNAILAKLEAVNKLRRSKGEPSIVMLGLGDSKQGAFIKGSISPKNSKSTPSKRGTFSSVFEASSSKYITSSKVELTHQFRFEIDEIRTAASDIETNLKPALTVNQSGEHKLEPINFRFKREKGNFTGVETMGSWEDTLNDTELSETIEEQLLNDENFSLLIVSGEDAYDGALSADTKLGKVIFDYIKNHPEEAKTKILQRGISSVQGSQATYTIANIPADYFGISYADLQKSGIKDKEPYINKVNRLSMIVGRSSRYSLLAMPTGFPIKSNSGDTTEPLQAETNQLKTMWGNLLINNVLKNYDTVRPLSNDSSDSETKLTDDPVVDDPTTDPSVEIINLNTTNDPTIESKKVESNQESIGNTSATIINETAQKAAVGLTSGTKESVVQELEAKKSATKDPSVTHEIENAIDLVVDFEAIVAGETTGEVFELPKVIHKLPPLTFTRRNSKDKAVMQNIEAKEGKVVMFSHRDSTQGRLSDASNLAKVLDVVKLYGSDKAVSNADYNFHFYNATGLNGEESRSEYSYELVSYRFEYTYKGELIVGHNHTVVATTGDGKKLIIGSFAAENNYSDDSNIRIWMAQRQKTLQSFNDDPASVDIFNTNKSADLFDKVATGSIGANGLPMVSVKINRLADLFDGVTVGSPVMGDAELLKLGKSLKGEFDKSKLDRMAPGEFQQGYALDTSATVNLLGATVAAVKKHLQDASVISSVHNFGTKTNPIAVAKFNNKPIVVIKTTRGDIPFTTTSSGKWIPVLGTVGKRLITDIEAVTIKHERRDDELHKISDKLKHITGLQTIEETTPTFKPDFDYDVDTLKSFKGNKAAELAYTRTEFKKKNELFFANHRISLEFALNKVWPVSGGPDSVSAPYVITRGKKEHVGKTIVLYSFDKTKRLDELTPKELQAQFNKSIEDQKAAKTDLSNHRNGIGIIILDSAPKTFSELSSELYSEENKNMNSKLFNRVIAHGNTGTEIIKLLATLHTALNSGVSEQIKALANDNLELLKTQLNTSDYAALSRILNKIFDPNNLGALRVGVDATTYQEITNIKALESRDAQQSVFDIIYQSSVIRPDLDALGISTLDELLSAPAVDGKDSIGLMRLKNGKPSITRSVDNVITLINKTTIDNLKGTGVITDQDFEVVPDINIIKLLSIIDGDATILAQLDAFMRAAPKLSQGMYVSPICAASTAAISRAVPASKNSSVESTLTTNIKQIRTPALVLDLERLLDGTAFKSKASGKGTTTFVVNDVQDRVNELLGTLNDATTIEELSTKIIFIKTAITELDLTEDEFIAYEQTLENAIVLKQKALSEDVSGKVTSLQEIIDVTDDVELKTKLEAFNRAGKLITTKEQLSDWLEAVNDLGVNLTLDEVFSAPTLHEQHTVVMEMLDKGLLLPDAFTVEPEINADDIIRNDKSFHGTNTSLLDMFLVYTNETNSIKKAQLKQALEGAIDIKQQVQARSKMDTVAFSDGVKNVKHKFYPTHIKNIVAQLVNDSIDNFDSLLTSLSEPSRYPKVFARMVLLANSEQKVKLYEAYLKDVLENYYNTVSRADALDKLFVAVTHSNISEIEKTLLQNAILNSGNIENQVPIELFKIPDILSKKLGTDKIPLVLNQHIMEAALYKNALDKESPNVHIFKENFISATLDTAYNMVDSGEITSDTVDRLSEMLEIIENDNNTKACKN